MASFGDLVLQPKAAAVAAGFTTKNGKKTQVKSGYRGVRQRPWGASPQPPRGNPPLCFRLAANCAATGVRLTHTCLQASSRRRFATRSTPRASGWCASGL